MLNKVNKSSMHDSFGRVRVPMGQLLPSEPVHLDSFELEFLVFLTRKPTEPTHLVKIRFGLSGSWTGPGFCPPLIPTICRRWGQRQVNNLSNPMNDTKWWYHRNLYPVAELGENFRGAVSEFNFFIGWYIYIYQIIQYNI
jgi:hypothetical protein